MAYDRDIAVDTEFLAKCLGLESWPDWQKLYNDHQRVAARVITDAFRPYSADGKIHPEIAIINATAWIDRVYEWGRQEGAREERVSWQTKIRKMFGV